MTWHATLGASSTKAWSICPGGTAYAKHHGLDKSKPGFSAMQGTAAHALVERCLTENSETSDYANYVIRLTDPENGSGVEFVKPEDVVLLQLTAEEFVVDKEMIEATAAMVNYVRRRVAELGVTMAEVSLEKRVHPLDGKHQELTGGTADVIIDAFPAVLEIVDYKHGAGVYVEAQDNPQLRSYALGAMRLSDDPYNAKYNDLYDEVIYTICQPRHPKAPYDGISSESTTPDELIEFGHELSKAVDRFLEAREKTEAGSTLEDLLDFGYIDAGPKGEACTFCPLKSQCPLLRRMAEETAMVDFVDDIPQALDVPGENRLAAIMPWVPFLKDWLASVEDAAKKHVLSGKKLEGYKLVRKTSIRRWRTDLSEIDLVKGLALQFGIEEGDLYEPPKMISGPKAIKLVPAKEKDTFERMFLVRPEGELTIAPMDDRRKEETIEDIAPMFDSPV